MEAKKRAAAITTDIARDEFGFSKKETSVTFEEMVNQYLEWSSVHHQSHASYIGYCNNFMRSLGKDTHIQSITQQDIEKHIFRRRHDVKPATINREISALKHMYKMAEQWGMTKHNPTLKVRKLREDNIRPRFLSDDERRNLLDACSDGPWYLLPIFLVAINTGMRRGEILSLKWEDVDLKNGVIRILKSKSGKTREIPLNAILKDLFNSMEKFDGYIFPVDEFKRSWTTASKRAGVSNLRFHDLRHEFASQLVMQNVDIRTVQELLGHSNLKMVMRYAHLSEAHKRDAVEKLTGLQRTPANEEDGKVFKLFKSE
jgi:integrase